MHLPDFYEPEMRDHLIPPDAEAKIGPIALRHRAELLDDIIPRSLDALKRYDCAMRFCFFDDESKVAAMEELGRVLAELGRANGAMFRTAFMAGEA